MVHKIPINYNGKPYATIELHLSCSYSLQLQKFNLAILDCKTCIRLFKSNKIMFLEDGILH